MQAMVEQADGIADAISDFGTKVYGAQKDFHRLPPPPQVTGAAPAKPLDSYSNPMLRERTPDSGLGDALSAAVAVAIIVGSSRRAIARLKEMVRASDVGK